MNPVAINKGTHATWIATFVLSLVSAMASILEASWATLRARGGRRRTSLVSQYSPHIERIAYEDEVFLQVEDCHVAGSFDYRYRR